MFALGSISFAAPWVLAALLALPALWWLLRVFPPAPKSLAFPPVRLLYKIVSKEETPHRTPWWLLLLRLVIASLIILGLARPLLDSRGPLPGAGPVVLIMDNGWVSGRDWQRRLDQADRIIDQAEKSGRPVAVAATAVAGDENDQYFEPLPPLEAKALVHAMQPQPWNGDRSAVLDWLARSNITSPAHVVWVSNGIADPDQTAITEEFAETFQRLGGLSVLLDPNASVKAILPPRNESGNLISTVQRMGRTSPETVWVQASAEEGRILARQEVSFAEGETTADAVFSLPVELRNEIERLTVEGEATAAASILLDERYRRRPVGLLSASEYEGSQPLLDELHYLDRALKPFTELRRDSLQDLLARELSVLMLVDFGNFTFNDQKRIEDWIKSGGVAVRFAGPRLASATAEERGLGPDNLLPIRLRAGNRTLDGSLSWSRAAHLSDFPENSPFHGLEVPEDVTVSRQLLAEPSLDLGDRTWAQLDDGTPVVTATAIGDGWLVLFHVTANAEWTNLPLSGLFVEMLRRIVQTSSGSGQSNADEPLPPLRNLDGFGRPSAPLASARPIDPALLKAGEVRISAEVPPGFYGDILSRQAVNLGPEVAEFAPMRDFPSGTIVEAFNDRKELDFRPPLLLAAFLLLLIDVTVVLVLRGAMPGRAATIALAFAYLLSPDSLSAQSPDAVENAIKATERLHLAYMVTNDPGVDAISKEGLTNLSNILSRRTAVEPGLPIAVDPEFDELAFFPLIYWPVISSQADLSERALAKINAYMRNGGMILIDTKDQYEAGFGDSGSGLRRLKELAQGLDIPLLAPVPNGHVLGKSFYLLKEFPGRYIGGQIWVEEGDGSSDAEVSPVLLGNHDWAGAWARQADGSYRFPVVPGGELQREMSYRFGVNLVMYALTGNYKADQVHIPAILERLGQ